MVDGSIRNIYDLVVVLFIFFMWGWLGCFVVIVLFSFGLVIFVVGIILFLIYGVDSGSWVLFMFVGSVIFSFGVFLGIGIKIS